MTTTDINIIELLGSDLSEDTKKRLFADWLSSQKTPKSIKDMLESADMSTKLAAVLQGDPRAVMIVFDILTKYGTLNYPVFRQ